MSWTSIITALALASGSAYLVMARKWEIWQATLMLGGGMILLVLTVLAVMLSLTPRQQRARELSEFKQGFLNTLNEMLKTLWPKSK